MIQSREHNRLRRVSIKQLSLHSIHFRIVILFVLMNLGTEFLEASSVKHPNVLLIMTDDQGYGDIQSHGNPFVQTPHQDQLAASGARFEHFFVSPVCAPTRASLLTGRYHLRTGVSGVTRGYENIRSEEITIAEVFKEAGYRTGCFGKWHNGRHMPMHPNGQGFETFFGFCGGHWNTYFDPPLELNGEMIETNGYIADVITNAAIDFTDRHEDDPWFCYVAYNTPHSPWRVPEKYWQKYEGMGLDVKAHCAYAMVENIDDNLGRLLEAIELSEQEEETIVLFLTDNGANSPRFNAGMLGRKGSVDEGGTRVPLFVRYPGVIEKSKVIKPIAFHLDILPTLAELCHIPLTPKHLQKLDGDSLVPLLVDDAAEESWQKRMLFTETFRAERGKAAMKAAVRTDQWRATMQKGRWRLFDMLKDPEQKEDVSKQNAVVVTELSEAFEKWFSQINLKELQNHSIPIGHPTRATFRLPANEADLLPKNSDGITYTGDTASGYANSWITEWTSKDSYPRWPIEVLEPGDYHLSIEYACNSQDAGCQFEISVAGQKELIDITQPHVAGLKQKPDHVYSSNYQDRTSWATLEVGTFELPKGHAELIIRFKNKPGEKGIEINSITLQRQD